MDPLEQYKRELSRKIHYNIIPHLRRKLARSMNTLLIIPPETSIPPPEKEQLSKEEAKDYVLRVFDEMIHSKKIKESVLEEALLSALPLVIVDTDDEKQRKLMEEKFLLALKSHVNYVVEKHESLLKSRRYRQLDKDIVDLILSDYFHDDVLAHIPSHVKALIYLHHLYRDPEVREKIKELYAELLSPPSFFDSDKWVDKIPRWYLRLLARSKGYSV